MGGAHPHVRFPSPAWRVIDRRTDSATAQLLRTAKLSPSGALPSAVTRREITFRHFEHRSVASIFKIESIPTDPSPIISDVLYFQRGTRHRYPVDRPRDTRETRL